MENNNKAIKFIGVAATALGLASTLMSNWVNNKQMEAIVNEKVGKAIESYLNNK